MDRDQEIRRLAHFVMRATGCKREVAIRFLCTLGEERREVVRAMKILEMLNKQQKPKKPTKPMPVFRKAVADELAGAAWSQPR